MPHNYQLILIVFLALIPTTVNAMTPPKSGNVDITMRSGHPCFSYPQDKYVLKLHYSFGSLDVSDVRHGGGWEIGLSDPYNKKELLEPNSPETCIKYGVLNSGMKETQPAELLRFDAPYKVRMWVISRSDGFSERWYASDFCLTRGAKGETILVNAVWNDDATAMKCLIPGESPKRSFWQKLFGK